MNCVRFLASVVCALPVLGCMHQTSVQSTPNPSHIQNPASYLTVQTWERQWQSAGITVSTDSTGAAHYTFPVNFGPDSYSLSKSAQNILHDFGQGLVVGTSPKSPRQVTVATYSDEVPDPIYGVNLATQRGAAVMKALLSGLSAKEQKQITIHLRPYASLLLEPKKTRSVVDILVTR